MATDIDSKRLKIMFKYMDASTEYPGRGYMIKNLYKDIENLTFMNFAPIYPLHEDLNKEETKEYIEKAFIYNKINIKSLIHIELIPETEIKAEIDYENF